MRHLLQEGCFEQKSCNPFALFLGAHSTSHYKKLGISAKIAEGCSFTNGGFGPRCESPLAHLPVHKYHLKLQINSLSHVWCMGLPSPIMMDVEQLMSGKQAKGAGGASGDARGTLTSHYAKSPRLVRVLLWTRERSTNSSFLYRMSDKRLFFLRRDPGLTGGSPWLGLGGPGACSVRA